MPTRSLQFEGRNLGALLEKVREEVGAGARIVKAERVRRGGFMGFFAREHFEVTVEIDVAGEGAAPTDGASANGADRPPGAAPAAPPTAAPPTGAPPTAAHAATSTAAAARAFLADQTKDVVDVSVPVPSTETATFASVLASVADETVARGTAFHERHEADRFHGAGESERLHQVHEPHGAAGGVVAEATEAEVEEVVEVEIEEIVVPVGAVAGGGDGFGEVHDAVEVPPAPPRDAQPPFAPPAPPSPVPPASSAATNGVAPGPGAAGPGPVVAAPAPASLPAVPPRIASAMAAAGIPAALMPDPSLLACIDRLSDGEDDPGYLSLALARMFDKLPGPPPVPVRHGSLLVVAGELERARGLAALLAGEAGLDPSEMPVATEEKPRTRVPPHLLIRTASEAIELAPGWRRGPRITVLALGVSLGKPSRTWARHMMEALRPTAVWGVVTATQKPEDIAAWAHDIGEIDALALEDLAHTVSPAAAVAAGIPVARLDGVPATPALWSSLLVARLTAERQLGQLAWC